MTTSRIVPAVHGQREVAPDPDFEIGLAQHLRSQNDPPALAAIYSRFVDGETDLDALMRRAVLRALAKSLGNGVQVSRGVMFKHAETFAIGRGVFIGEQAFVQGRFDGRCEIGDHVWIGPQAYFDARDLIIEEYVGWGPGAKVLGSSHTGRPADVPIIQTELDIKPVVIEAWADVGMNASILPGIRVGKGAVVGAGAVVTHDVEPFSIVAGVPARVIGRRDHST